MLGFLNWFLPAEVRARSRDEVRRALLTVAACWLTAMVASLTALLQAFWGVRQVAIVCMSAGAATALVTLVVRATGRWRLAAWALCGLIWGAAFSVTALTGGVLVPALYYLVFAAAIAAVTIGFRAGIAISLLTIGVLAGVYFLHLSGVRFPVEVDPERALGSGIRGALIFNVALGALVGFYEFLRSAALSDSAESERRYRALADHGPDLIAEVDASGRVLHTSASAGPVVSALVGRPALEAIHPADHARVREALRQLDVQPSVRVGPLRWNSRDGDIHWFEASLTRFQTATEARILAVARDVTQRITLEEQLRQSQKMEAVGQLASGLAHDFNNLLLVISGYADRLTRRAQGDPTQRSDADEILRATDRGAALTRRLLALTRPTAAERQALDLNAIVRENEGILRVLLGEGTSLTLDLAPGVLPCVAAAGELEQVLVNLVVNARDALDTRGSVRITSSRRDGRVALAVRDDGAGMDAATRERAFEPFFTTKAPGQGTGLGLYVVYGVVTSLGGEISLVSELGGGTQVTLDLPESATPGPAQPRPRRVSAVPKGVERILVVEDVPELRTLLRNELADAGYQVIVAADGMEALSLALGEEIDLVVSDIVMPRMNGTALVAALRERRPGLGAVFVSAHPGDRTGIEPGDPLLRKPFRMRDLHRVVRETLGSG